MIHAKQVGTSMTSRSKQETTVCDRRKKHFFIHTNPNKNPPLPSLSPPPPPQIVHTHMHSFILQILLFLRFRAWAQHHFFTKTSNTLWLSPSLDSPSNSSSNSSFIAWVGNERRIFLSNQSYWRDPVLFTVSDKFGLHMYNRIH